MAESGLDLQIRFAPYNQVFQQLLDPSGLLATNRSGVNAILVRLEDWAASGLESLSDTVAQFAEGLHTAAGFPSPTVVLMCPSSPEFLANPGRREALTSLQETLRTETAALSSVHLVTTAELNALYPVADYYDAHGDELGHIPYTAEFFAALGTMLARKVHVLKRSPYKVIVLDCDETLWLGVCGEDGPQGIIVDAPHRELQEFMLAQHAAGALLCLSSKNNEEDVLETFRLNPTMPLRMEHFVETRINWEPKSENIKSLAEELDLGLDSFIFVDDNAAECAQVSEQCPEVLCVNLPVDTAEIPHFLQHVWAFDRLKVTDEDRQRTALYVQRGERSRLERQSASLEEFLAALQLEVDIAPLTPEQLPRASQLTLRTNQMNISGKRRTEGELRELLSSGCCECLTVHVRDRFGDYGLVGMMLYQLDEESVTLDTFLLSCRALGKGVEHRMLATLGQIAEQRGLKRVTVPFVAMARNRPAKLLLESVGAKYRVVLEGMTLYQFPAEYLAGLTYKATEPVAHAGVPVVKTIAVKVPVHKLNYVRVARELATPQQIMNALRAAKPAIQTSPVSGVVRGTPLEQKLVAIWSELLGLPTVGIHDNFFDLGGHSLLAVQLLSAVRQAFDVDLSLEIVYSGVFTVAELAKAIELYQIQEAGAGEYEELLLELEGLTDEEVQALLEQESESGAQS
jgi:FkbH-like protein